MWQLNGEKNPKLVYGKGNQYKKRVQEYVDHSKN